MDGTTDAIPESTTAASSRLWRNSRLDAILLALCLAQFVATVALAATWTGGGLAWWALGFALVTFMMTYNIIILSHLFVHQPWFTSARLNSAVSVLNSANIAQSVEAYELTHVRNHHRYNNDRKDENGATKDTTSTFRYGRDGEHAKLGRYLAYSLWWSIVDFGATLWSATRLFRVGRDESLMTLAAPRPPRRTTELRQVQLDRLAHVAFLLALLAISWQWTLLCYLPAVATAFTLVNVQNYYRHFGAHPESRYANSVSHYGRLYNRLTFNDGYHQEHHLRPATHWSRLPTVAREYGEEFDEAGRVVSPVPAIVGFLDRERVVAAQ